MKKTLVIAPHPDDETLGCGGTLFRHKLEGDDLYWLIVTCISNNSGWSKDEVNRRNEEIDKVSKKFAFKDVFNLSIPTTKIDTIPLSELISKITNIYKKVEPEIIYMPFVDDVHTDHRIIAEVVQSTFKWFRNPFINKILMYETPSETDFNFISQRKFHANVFIDISNHIKDKIEAMKIYESEMGEFPFPRSEKSIRSLAALRGSQSGFKSAEAFELVFERK